MIIVSDLETGVVARVGLPRFAKMADKGLVQIRRDIRNGRLQAITDEGGRLFVESSEALRYLRGTNYKHNPLDRTAISRMEHARAARTQSKSIE